MVPHCFLQALQSLPPEPGKVDLVCIRDFESTSSVRTDLSQAVHFLVPLLARVYASAHAGERTPALPAPPRRASPVAVKTGSRHSKRSSKRQHVIWFVTSSVATYETVSLSAPVGSAGQGRPIDPAETERAKTDRTDAPLLHDVPAGKRQVTTLTSTVSSSARRGPLGPPVGAAGL